MIIFKVIPLLWFFFSIVTLFIFEFLYWYLFTGWNLDLKIVYIMIFGQKHEYQLCVQPLNYNLVLSFKLYIYDLLVKEWYYIGSLVKKIVEGPPKNLLETVAEHIATKMLETFPKINVIRVKLGKPYPALLKSTVDYLGVELFRKRKH